MKMPKPWLMKFKEKFGSDESAIVIVGFAAVLIAGAVYLVATLIKENGSVRRIQVTGETIKDIGEAFFE